MSNRQLVTASLVLSVMASGCATVMPMAFSENAAAPPAAGKVTFLMTLTSRNVYKPSYQPKLLVVNVERPNASDSKDRFNFKMDDSGRAESEAPQTGNNYLIRMQLDQGEYLVRGFTSFNHGFLINATFFAPLHGKLQVVAPGVYYLGHVDTTVRERVGGEFTAGAPIPLIDQAVSGASGGTFDVSVTDGWQIDGPRFLAAFPGLRQIAVRKMVLPPFDRAAAQKWWETN